MKSLPCPNVSDRLIKSPIEYVPQPYLMGFAAKTTAKRVPLNQEVVRFLYELYQMGQQEGASKLGMTKKFVS